MAKSRRAPEEVARRRPDDDDDEPRRKGRRHEDEDAEDDEPQAPRKKRKSAAGPVKLILRICLCVALAIALVVLLWWVYTPVGTDYALLCYFPPETTQLCGYDVDECSRNGKLKEVHDTLISNYKTMFAERRINQDAAGVSVTDVDKYLTGVASGNADEEKDLDPQDRRGALTVIRFKQAVDQGKFVASFAGTYKAEERKTKDGKTFYQVWRESTVRDHTEREDDFSFFFPNSRTLVYATTRREIQEAMSRSPSKIAVTGNMRDLADKVDGHFFRASTAWVEINGMGNALAYDLSFVNEDVRDPKKLGGVAGNASWFASNGNDFLYASATLFADAATARDVKRKLKESFDKAKGDAYGGEGKLNVDNPFDPKPKAGGPNQGFAGANTSNEQTKDIVEALREYAKTSRVYNRGRLVVVEGTISHGMPEQGVFERFWSAVGQKFRIQQQFGGGFPGGGPPMPGGPGGPMGPGGPPPGMPMPGRPGG